MGVKLNSSGGGSVEINPPSTGSTFTLTAPARTGNIITSADTGTITGTMLANGSVTSATLANGSVTTAALANGSVTTAALGVVTGANTAITGAPTTQTIASSIPAGVRRFTIMVRPVDCSAGQLIIQLGTASGYVTSGYVGGAQYGSSASYYPWSSGAIIPGAAYGTITWYLMDSTEHIWATSQWLAFTSGSGWGASGTVKLSSALTQARFNSSGGAASITGAFSYTYE